MELSDRDPHEDVSLNVMLPLPLDVLNTLNGLLGRAYPNMTIDTTEGRGWLKMRIPEEDRTERQNTGQVPDDEVVEAVIHAEDVENEGDMLGFDNGQMLLSTPEKVQLHLSELLAKVMESNENAVNYMEWTAVRGEGEGMVVSVSRSAEQTPHELRMAAERTLEQIREWADERRLLAPGLMEELYEILPGVQMTPDAKAQFKVT